MTRFWASLTLFAALTGPLLSEARAAAGLGFLLSELGATSGIEPAEQVETESFLGLENGTSLISASAGFDAGSFDDHPLSNLIAPRPSPPTDARLKERNRAPGVDYWSPPDPSERQPRLQSFLC